MPTIAECGINSNNKSVKITGRFLNVEITVVICGVFFVTVYITVAFSHLFSIFENTSFVSNLPLML